MRIAGIRGGHWRYRCHVLNERTGATWVEVTELDVPHLAAGVARAAGSRPDARNPPARPRRARPTPTDTAPRLFTVEPTDAPT